MHRILYVLAVQLKEESLDEAAKAEKNKKKKKKKKEKRVHAYFLI